jgi:hypothetical protein
MKTSLSCCSISQCFVQNVELMLMMNSVYLMISIARFGHLISHVNHIVFIFPNFYGNSIFQWNLHGEHCKKTSFKFDRTDPMANSTSNSTSTCALDTIRKKIAWDAQLQRKHRRWHLTSSEHKSLFWYWQLLGPGRQQSIGKRGLYCGTSPPSHMYWKSWFLNTCIFLNNLKA